MRVHQYVQLTIVVVGILFVLLTYSRVGVPSISEHYREKSKCETIHVGVVMLGYGTNVYFYKLLKSIYLWRSAPLNFHIVVDSAAEKNIKVLFETWAVPHVHLDIYNIESSTLYSDLGDMHNPGPELLKLLFPAILPKEVTTKIIVADPELIFAENIQELWNLFDTFNNQKFIGLSKTNADVNLKVTGKYTSTIILYHLENLEMKYGRRLWIQTIKEYISIVDDIEINEIITGVAHETLNDVYDLPCLWNTTMSGIASSCVEDNKVKFVHSLKYSTTIEADAATNEITSNTVTYDANLLRRQLEGCVRDVKNVTTRSVPKQCDELPDAKMTTRRTLLYFREFKHNVTKDDVTLVTQLSYNKLEVFEEIAKRWLGPMSLSIYVTDSELLDCIKYIENSPILQNRTNIAFHAIFKEGRYYPINALRNVAWGQVVTAYVFLNDVDLVPMQNSYSIIKDYIAKQDSMDKKALVVPAFEKTVSNGEIPLTKTRLLKMMKNQAIRTMKYYYRPEAHRRSNYAKWKIAKVPFEVLWEPKYEPYIVVRSNVTKYDERFFAYGKNKIAQIMELNMQQYKFVVLPNAFVVHKNHPPSNDRMSFKNARTYKLCLKALWKSFERDLIRKYSINGAS